jgi:hypothetical protein
MQSVKIEDECQRCGKTAELAMSLDEAQHHLNARKQRDESRDDLVQQLGATLDESYPDIIIAVRNPKTGKHTIKTMDAERLCHAPEAKRNKGCRTAVTRILNDLFMGPKPPTAPKKKKNKEEEPEE